MSAMRRRRQTLLIHIFSLQEMYLVGFSTGKGMSASSWLFRMLLCVRALEHGKCFRNLRARARAFGSIEANL
ncbi:hypothetical protein ANAPC5_01182 [Anaplasma phagocytophilum]|nr:hypothetical protein ANAPC5_01182 [Anaplasma phagocytophilum]